MPTSRFSLASFVTTSFLAHVSVGKLNVFFVRNLAQFSFCTLEVESNTGDNRAQNYAQDCIDDKQALQHFIFGIEVAMLDCFICFQQVVDLVRVLVVAVLDEISHATSLLTIA